MRFVISTASLRRVGRYAAILALAFGAGHVAQTLADGRQATPDPVAALAPVNIVQLSASPPMEAVAEPAIRPRTGPVFHVPPARKPLAKPQVDGVKDCAPRMTLAAAAGAMVEVRLAAPCDAQGRVVLSHAGLVVTEQVQPDGTLMVRLPALDEMAQIEIGFADGRSVMASVAVPELAQMKRFAIQWLGVEGFVLHGLQAGAEDISPSQPGMIADGTAWLNLLGDANVTAPLLAQIYTFPQHDHRAEIMVEAHVTAQTCGQDLLGQTLISVGGRSAVTDLTVAMPDCSAVGDVLVLKNLATDTKLAAR